MMLKQNLNRRNRNQQILKDQNSKIPWLKRDFVRTTRKKLISLSIPNRLIYYRQKLPYRITLPLLV